MTTTATINIGHHALANKWVELLQRNKLNPVAVTSELQFDDAGNVTLTLSVSDKDEEKTNFKGLVDRLATYRHVTANAFERSDTRYKLTLPIARMDEAITGALHISPRVLAYTA